MKRLANILAIPAIICFFVMLLWGESVREYNVVLYFIIFAILGVGYISTLIQNERNSKDAIAREAIAQYKKDNEH